MSTIFGVLASVVSGVLNGSFAVPMKKTLKWEWENTWLIYALTAMIFYPLVMTLLFVPNLIGIYQQTPSNVLWQTFLFGMGWGIGSVMFGLGLHLVGLSLGYTIRSEEHTSELQSHSFISYAVFCWKKKTRK